MAIVFESSAQNSGGGTLTITKPTGLAVGDLMIACISGGGPSTIGKPTGWTEASKQNGPSGASTSAVLWIIATSTEVAASDFSFTFSAADGSTGIIYRISGFNTTTPIALNKVNGGTSNSQVYANTITPANADSALIFYMAGFKSGTSTPSNSAYAITNNNPSWSEDMDRNVNGGGYFQWGAAAHASRPETTATGDSSCTVAGTGDNYNTGWMIVINPAAAGPANLKTVNGLAKASVKTVNGLAMAGIKTYNGLT